MRFGKRDLGIGVLGDEGGNKTKGVAMGGGGCTALAADDDALVLVVLVHGRQAAGPNGCMVRVVQVGARLDVTVYIY